eukprot:9511727-Karenia_brevis.AAC.1
MSWEWKKIAMILDLHQEVVTGRSTQEDFQTRGGGDGVAVLGQLQTPTTPMCSATGVEVLDI